MAVGIGISPFLRRRRGTGITPIPNPPYIIFSRNKITGLHYDEGTGPSAASVSFNMSGVGLPGNGTAVITPPADFEMYDPTAATWKSVPFNYAYTVSGGAFITANIFMVRLKAGHTVGSLNQNFTLETTGAPDFTLNVQGFVSVNNNVIVAYGGAARRDGNYIIREAFAGIGNIAVTANPVASAWDEEGWGAGGSGASGGGSFNGNGPGGGSSGERKFASFIPAIGNYSYSIGVGGASVIGNAAYGNKGLPGSPTIFRGITYLGGGGGGVTQPDPVTVPPDGDTPGGGGGARGASPFGLGGAAVGRIKKGGDGFGTAAPYNGGGGGGNGSAGKDGDDATEPGYGGDGELSTIKGGYVVGGGAGASYNTQPVRLGGSGVGGNSGGGASPAGDNGQPGATNTGSGGGAGVWAGVGTVGGDSGAGADGYVGIKYFSPGPVIDYVLGII